MCLFGVLPCVCSGDCHVAPQIECATFNRSSMSTSHALIDLVEEISESMDKQLYTLGVFIDLKKAFDIVNHTILIQKLNLYGIRGVAEKWIESYLSDRKQFVKNM